MSYFKDPPPRRPQVPAVISCVSLTCIKIIGKPYTPYKGAVLVPCPMCGDQMWLGPACKAKHEAEGIPIACALCIAKNGGDLGQSITLTDKKVGE